MTPLTAEYAKRITQTIKETESKLTYELGFIEDLRNNERIVFLQSHISKLNDMLQNGWNAPAFK